MATRIGRCGMWMAAVAILLCGGLPAMAQDKPAEGGKTLQIDGSTTVGPIAEAFAAYMMKADTNLKITVKQTGSGDGAAALIDGRCDIATMSRFMKPEEFKKAVEKGVMPVAHAIAMDGVCIVVHPSNPVKALTIAQLRDIYTGKINNWKALGGPDAAIVAVSRDTSSGTYETFETLVMNKQKMFDKVEYVNSSNAAHARAAETAGGIAYVGLGFVDAKVHALAIEGIGPDRKTIAAGKYPLSRPLFLFTNGYPVLGSSVHQFVNLFLNEKGQEMIEAKGFVPVTNY